LEGKKIHQLGDDRISDRDKEEGGRMARGLSGVESIDRKGMVARRINRAVIMAVGRQVVRKAFGVFYGEQFCRGEGQREGDTQWWSTRSGTRRSGGWGGGGGSNWEDRGHPLATSIDKAGYWDYV
jgi:hypothetical protein